MFPWSMLTNKNDQFNEWMKKINESGMDKQFEGLLSRFMQKPNSHPQDTQATATPVEIIETAEYIFVKIPLKDRFSLNNLKIHYSFNKLFITGLPNQEEQQVYLFPALVRKKDSHAYFQNNILELKFPKHIDKYLATIDLRRFVADEDLP